MTDGMLTNLKLFWELE